MIFHDPWSIPETPHPTILAFSFCVCFLWILQGHFFKSPPSNWSTSPTKIPEIPYSIIFGWIIESTNPPTETTFQRCLQKKNNIIAEIFHTLGVIFITPSPRSGVITHPSCPLIFWNPTSPLLTGANPEPRTETTSETELQLLGPLGTRRCLAWTQQPQSGHQSSTHPKEKKRSKLAIKTKKVI